MANQGNGQCISMPVTWRQIRALNMDAQIPKINDTEEEHSSAAKHSVFAITEQTKQHTQVPQ